MNVKQELMKQEKVKNIVCREDGTLEVYSFGNVQNQVLRFINMNSLNSCFIKIDFHNMETWI
jgi:hypothetical protein